MFHGMTSLIDFFHYKGGILTTVLHGSHLGIFPEDMTR
jgi:hypothetical protein